MSRPGLLSLICVAAATAQFALPAWAVEENASTPGPRMHRDTICGPRCVQMILGQYGIDADLIELVKETQWPDMEMGANLAALEPSLRKRGLYTCAIKLHPDAELVWARPVLVHLKGSNSGGHYVVWIPGSEGRSPVAWDWSNGTRPWNCVARTSSGNVVLTASAPIDNPEAAARLRNWLQETLFIAGALLLIGSIFMLIRRTRARSTRPHNSWPDSSVQQSFL